MSDLITNTYPVTLHEVAYLRAEQESRPWYVVYRAELDVVGVTAEVQQGDEVVMVCEKD